MAYASFNWDQLLPLSLKRGTQLFTALPKFPTVRRDLALLVDAHISYAEIADVVSSTERKLLKDVFLFDVYEGEHLPEGKKSYAIGMLFQDANKTLNDKAVDKSVQRILHQLSERLDAQLR